MISIIVPSYGRADRIARVVQNIHENTLLDHEVLVIVEPEEQGLYTGELPDSRSGNHWLFENERTRNYAGAINTANKYASGKYVFLAADDLNFHSEWDFEAMKVMNGIKSVKVVGTNDLLNTFVLEGWHATHYLVDRDYIDNPGGVIDGHPGDVLYEGYDHNYSDTEFIGTAKARAVFAPCLDSVVEHLHWTAGKMVKDSTAFKTDAQLSADCEIYESRQHLWWGLSV